MSITASVKQKNNVHVTGNESAAQTIIFGHGFGSDQTAFAPIVKAFAADYKIVLYDNVGGGKADIDAFNPSRYSTMQGYVTDLSDIIRALQLSDVIYVGHSVSGMIGLLTANKYPEYFSKLILLGSSPRYLNDIATGYTGGFDMETLNSLYSAMSTNYYAWASGFSALVMSNPDQPHLAEAFAATLSAIRPDIALSVAKAIFEMDHRQDLALCTIPSLVVQTSDDVAVPGVVGEYLQQHIPDSQQVNVQATGHFPHIVAPEEVIRAIRSFIQ
ncbi:alpha/beta fold hydrolase [Chitinophaga rhizophila]|uniref:Alpha/beta hydrolase n=1 Tax=Chitinophaga rhizophila TaxID=2866212 RepID=A0ABS7GA77_9BACT|nr:alpha/beta hydrolase [Chitinophaga rhizophila]MBW8684563.1 alpha/beta hydrolase [Chitinophaga rhizophila]